VVAQHFVSQKDEVNAQIIDQYNVRPSCSIPPFILPPLFYASPSPSSLSSLSPFSPLLIYFVQKKFRTKSLAEEHQEILKKKQAEAKPEDEPLWKPFDR
jgi:hypothetical protein